MPFPCKVCVLVLYMSQCGGKGYVRVFVTKSFRRFQRKEGIKDAALSDAVERAERRLIAADLGGGLIKQRMARPGEGRSGGFRTIVAYRSGRRAFFVFGFAKSDRDNLSAADERDLKDFAGLLMGLSERGIQTMVNGKELTEVRYEEEG
jgi:hypothetical protein